MSGDVSSGLLKEGNKFKLFQIIHIDSDEIKDSLLYEIATSSPIGCIGTDHWLAPSYEYYHENIIKNHRLSVVFPEPIGVSNIIKVSDLTPEEREKIEIVDRNGRSVRAVNTDRAALTCECQLVISSDLQLITMYPGEFAPTLPSSPDEPSEFWDNHVFIIHP